MKRILLIAAVAFMFSACNKCVECTREDSSGSNVEYTICDQNGNIETYGDLIEEICSDNFESKNNFNEYIYELEKEYDYDCKSDFWN